MTETTHSDRLQMTATFIAASIFLAAGLVRVFAPEAISARLDEIPLYYLGAAAVVLVSNRIKSLKIGDAELELQTLRDEVKGLGQRVGIAEDSARVNIAAPPPVARMGLMEGPPVIEPGRHNDDPWKGVFGGPVDSARGRRLVASVEELVGEKDLYAVRLVVEGTPGHPALDGKVQFFLHDTFPNDRPVVPVIKGQATLRLKAWGAFTVGVLADGGQTKLELDLAELPSAPQRFREL